MQRSFSALVIMLCETLYTQMSLILDYPHPVMPFKIGARNTIVLVLHIFFIFSSISEDDSDQTECLTLALHS